MKHILIGFVISMILVSGVVAAQDELAWERVGEQPARVTAVAAAGGKAQTLYYGTDQGVFASFDAGRTWRPLLYLSGSRNAVYRIITDAGRGTILYAATANGLLRSQDSGKSWARIFEGKNARQRRCRSLAVLDSLMLVGTEDGLFVSKTFENIWHKQPGQLGTGTVFSLAYHAQVQSTIYAGSTAGVFRSDDGGASWQKISLFRSRQDEEQLELEEELAEQPSDQQVRSVSVDPGDPKHVLFAAGRSIYASSDGGISWVSLAAQGSFDGDLQIAVFAEDSTMYAATQTSVYAYGDQNWRRVSARLVAERIHDLASIDQGRLLAACDKGLYISSVPAAAVTGHPDGKEPLQAFEPSIERVQQAAIHYAEVNPEKIQAWRKACARKAWLPQVAVGLDRDVADLWHWEGGSTARENDDILRKGQDTVTWDLRLCWDLSDLVWNDDQTVIDVRSKLMVELRDDIVDQVTRVYFERLRVMMELDELGITDLKKKKEKQLKVRELTAYLDGFTGGFFSDSVRSAQR